MRRRIVVVATWAALIILAGSGVRSQERFRFRTGVDLVNVTATVTDDAGHFVPGLTQGDFVVFEDEQRVEVTHFSAERVPVSLGIVVDTSGSMTGEKLDAARSALARLLVDLLGPEDEVFLYRFDNGPHLVTGWTSDRSRIAADLQQLRADGATALYDAVAEALPLLESGRHRKKALLVISDGNDTSSHTDLPALKRLIRESEALVYAIGIDSRAVLTQPGGGAHEQRVRFQRRRPFPLPIPMPSPGRRPPPRNPPIPGVPPGPVSPRPKPTDDDEPSRAVTRRSDEPVNGAALRDITDDTGGGTEIISNTRDLAPATARIADELSRQYYLGYPSRAGRDGKWHSIRVEIRDRTMRVRARRGYTAAS